MGIWVVIGAIVVAMALGGYRMVTDGRARSVAGLANQSPVIELPGSLGEKATFVQFSAPVCAPCRVTHRMIGEITSDRPEIGHVVVDVSQRLDLADQFGVTRTPTVLLLDADGNVRQRLVGAAKKGDLLAALVATS